MHIDINDDIRKRSDAACCICIMCLDVVEVEEGCRANDNITNSKESGIVMHIISGSSTALDILYDIHCSLVVLPVAILLVGFARLISLLFCFIFLRSLFHFINVYRNRDLDSFHVSGRYPTTCCCSFVVDDLSIIKRVICIVLLICMYL